MTKKNKLPWQGIVMGIGYTVISLFIVGMGLLMDSGESSVGETMVLIALPFAVLAWGFFKRKRWAPIISFIKHIIGVPIIINSILKGAEVGSSIMTIFFLLFFIYCDLVCISNPQYILNQKKHENS